MEAAGRLAEYVWEMIWPFGVSDLIDILIMAFIIYRVILLTRKTSSGGAVAKGIFLVLVVLWLSISSVLRLNTVSFLLGRMVELRVLALVIVFQPEIRRFFEQVGTSGRISLVRLFRDNGPSSEVERAIQETVEAYQEMSANKVGALLVFERAVKVDNRIS